jgi:hypothetical protein
MGFSRDFYLRHAFGQRDVTHRYVLIFFVTLCKKKSQNKEIRLEGVRCNRTLADIRAVISLNTYLNGTVYDLEPTDK